MAYRLTASSEATAGDYIFSQESLNVAADYPANSNVLEDLFFANGTRRGTMPASVPPNPNTIIDTAGGNWQTVANTDVRKDVPNGIAPSVGTLDTAGYDLLDPEDVRLGTDIGNGTPGTLVPAPVIPSGLSTADAIRATLESWVAVWAAQYPADVAWRGLDFDPEGITGPWIIPMVNVAGTLRASMTGEPDTGHRYTGSLTIDIYLPADSGTGAGTRIQDSLWAMFHEKQFAVTGSANPVTFDSNASFSDVSGNGPWAQFSWSCPFALYKI